MPVSIEATSDARCPTVWPAASITYHFRFPARSLPLGKYVDIVNYLYFQRVKRERQEYKTAQKNVKLACIDWRSRTSFSPNNFTDQAKGSLACTPKSLSVIAIVTREPYGLSGVLVGVVVPPSFRFNFGGACCCSAGFCSPSVVVVVLSSGVGCRRFNVGLPGAPPSSPA